MNKVALYVHLVNEVGRIFIKEIDPYNQNRNYRNQMNLELEMSTKVLEFVDTTKSQFE